MYLTGCFPLIGHTLAYVVEFCFVVEIVVYVFKIFENVAIVGVGSVGTFEDFGSLFEQRHKFLCTVGVGRSCREHWRCWDQAR